MHKISLNIPFSLRILIIIQLCIGLCSLIWLAGYPFMGGYFTTQSELILIESVMGKQDTLKRLDLQKSNLLTKKMEENASRFYFLSEPEKNFIKNLFLVKKNALMAPFPTKIHDAMKLFSEIPHLEVIWILLSIAIPVLILLRAKGIVFLVWLLPLVTCGYVLNNQIHGLDPLTSSDRGMFPREETLSGNSIVEAWDHYLVKNWGRDRDEGEFYFNVARLNRLPSSLSASFWERKSLLLIVGYILWNINFAWRVSQNESKRVFKQTKRVE